MSRLAPLAPEEMPPAQREAYEEIIAHQRGGARGPFGVWVRSLGLVAALRGLMRFYLEESVLTEDIRELAVLARRATGERPTPTPRTRLRRWPAG